MPLESDSKKLPVKYSLHCAGSNIALTESLNCLLASSYLLFYFYYIRVYLLVFLQMRSVILLINEYDDDDDDDQKVIGSNAKTKICLILAETIDSLQSCIYQSPQPYVISYPGTYSQACCRVKCNFNSSCFIINVICLLYL